jgi:hypothetical protein
VGDPVDDEGRLSVAPRDAVGVKLTDVDLQARVDEILMEPRVVEALHAHTDLGAVGVDGSPEDLDRAQLTRFFTLVLEPVERPVGSTTGDPRP